MKNVNLIVMIFLIFSGCGGGLFESSIDTGTNAEGEEFLLDTKKNWDTWVTFIDIDINKEMNGKPPTAGYKNWNDRWLARINAIVKAKRENYQKYVNYIIDTRKSKGLPDLEFTNGV